MFNLFSEIDKETEKWKKINAAKLCPVCQYPEFDPRCPHWGPDEPAPSYWSEKAKDRREEFKREQAEDRERAYPDREWEKK